MESLSSIVKQQVSFKRQLVATCKAESFHKRSKTESLPRGPKSVRFDLEKNQIYPWNQSEEDFKNSWISEEDEIRCLQTIDASVHAYQIGSRHFGDETQDNDDDFSVHDFEQYINAYYKVQKHRQVKRIRQSILQAKTMASADVAGLSTCPSAVNNIEAKDMAAFDVAAALRIYSMESGTICSFPSTSNTSAAVSSVAVNLNGMYSLFSLRKPTRMRNRENNTHPESCP